MFAGQESGPVAPRITEWTPERAELVKLNENMQMVASLIISVAGGQSQPLKPEPRPETALDRLNARLEDASYNYLLERIEEARTREG